LSTWLGFAQINMNTSFERTENGKDEWLTPQFITQPLGHFDLDPCAPINPPWVIAEKRFTVTDNGLLQPWEGRVWCNPPYGLETGKWMERCALHANVMALTFARTETKMFHNWIFPFADAIFFFYGRIRFYHVDGTKGGTAGSPSCLIAYGENNVEALRKSGLRGKFLMLHAKT
jgi:hypothetical protein